MMREKISKILPIIGICCGMPILSPESVAPKGTSQIPVSEPLFIKVFENACREITCMYISEQVEEDLKRCIIMYSLQHNEMVTNDIAKKLKETIRSTIRKTPETMHLEDSALNAVTNAQATLSMIENFRSVCQSITPASNRREVGEKLKNLLVEHGELTNDTAQTLTSIAEKTFTSSDLIPFKTVTLDAIINARVELSRKAKAL